MKNDKTERAHGSIVGRLTLLYTLSASVLLIGVTLFLYEVLVTNLLEEDKQFLAEKAYIIKNLVQESEDDLTSLEQEIQRGTVIEKVIPYYTYFSRILASNNIIIAESPGMATVVPVTIFPEPISEMEQSNLVEFCFIWKAADDHPYILLALQSTNKTGQPHIIQVALDIAREDALLANYKRKLVMILPLGVLFSAVFGAFVARRGMQPLQNITLAAQRITASQLHDRIDPTQWPRELRTLAEAFDQMLERLKGSFTQLTQFSDDLAHEFRTPINNLMGEIQVTLVRARSEKEYRDVLESSLEECSRLSCMIDSLLFLARADNVQIPLQLVNLDARRELEAICESYEAVIEEQGVKALCEGESNLVVDPILFRRAVTNVLANAIRHTPKGGQIILIVESSTDAHNVAIRITDNGCGIAPEHLSKVFDRFYRVDQARSTDSHNTGLGLAIVRSILAMHGGTVSIESELHKGTTVTLNFLSEK
ncbi:MAG: heavy metal sensor histidine kinase [Betaproteobacteria bacterium]|nr:heavy metal sensor histidine kinase [Betaproteobacteria bacterium]